MSEKIFLGGLWKNKTRDGKLYLSGKLGLGGKVLIFPNDFKRDDNDPDYKLYLVAAGENRDAPPEEPENLPF